MESVVGESTHNFVYQNERDGFGGQFNEWMGFDKERHMSDGDLNNDGDQCSRLEDYGHETAVFPDSEHVMRDAEEDEQGDTEEYLNAFDSDESADNVKADQTDRASADIPLYDGAPISVAVSMLLIVTFAIRHGLTGLAVVDLLTPVSLHCAMPNSCASSLDLIKKFF